MKDYDIMKLGAKIGTGFQNVGAEQMETETGYHEGAEQCSKVTNGGCKIIREGKRNASKKYKFKARCKSEDGRKMSDYAEKLKPSFFQCVVANHVNLQRFINRVINWNDLIYECQRVEKCLI